MTTTSLRISPEGRRSVVLVTGEVDLFSAPALRQVLRCAGSDFAGEVVVDLTWVTFIDCAGLAPLVEARERIGERLSLRGQAPLVTELLVLTGLHGVFVSHDEVESGPGVRNDPLADFKEFAPASGVPGLASRVGERDRVEQAKGLLMGALGCDARQAWQVLVLTADFHHVDVHRLVSALTALRGSEDEAPHDPAMDAALQAVMTQTPRFPAVAQVPSTSP